MFRLPSLRGSTSPLTYALAAPALLLSQHLMAVLAYWAAGANLVYDRGFWLLPVRTLAQLGDLSAPAAALLFAYSLGVAWALAVLSFRRASRSGVGYWIAAASIVPAFQVLAIVVLAILPVRSDDRGVEEEQGGGADRPDIAHVVQGVLAGVGIIVFAVLISAVTFGAYGWGLFVGTPFMVGVTTAYLANRRVPLETGLSAGAVLTAATLGSLALLMTALEGFLCILLAAPLGAIAALAGGALGRAAAIARHGRDKPMMSLALLPAFFALEAAIPPAAPIVMEQSIDISAPPSAVWRVLTSDEAIAAPPGLVGQAGLAYPTGGRILGAGIGAERLGFFSTGVARERITEWLPNRRLSFAVLEQPPAMEEMSPYRRVHAPHVRGYFETGGTRCDLKRLPSGGTRLTIRASHILRIDPVLYWEPLARWAVRSNAARVLGDIKRRSEAKRLPGLV